MIFARTPLFALSNSEKWAFEPGWRPGSASDSRGDSGAAEQILGGGPI